MGRVKCFKATTGSGDTVPDYRGHPRNSDGFLLINGTDDECGNTDVINRASYSLLPSAQIVLMHEGVLMGLLVTGREDRHWNERERSEIEQLLKRWRSPGYWISVEWFEQQLSQQQRLTRVQRDLLDNLLHRFAIPTALRTFGNCSSSVLSRGC